MSSSQGTSTMTYEQFRRIQSRRSFLNNVACGLGSIALGDLLTADRLSAATADLNPLLPRKPHFAPKAKSVIFLFMEGGPSQMDLFDPKPKLNELAGQPLPESFGKVITAMGEAASPLLASQRSWKQHGQSGIWLSDWLPELASCADDLAV